jgi:hypothetical protein
LRLVVQLRRIDTLQPDRYLPHGATLGLFDHVFAAMLSDHLGVVERPGRATPASVIDEYKRLLVLRHKFDRCRIGIRPSVWPELRNAKGAADNKEAHFRFLSIFEE